jgi:RNA polymerase sigma-70 factor (ECF subfamily)
MADRQASPLLEYLRGISRPPDAEQTDGELLERFAAQRDPAAFAALMHRHGPMVLAVCRRVLAVEADAEDAFQATFLVLARKAGSIARRELLANWLYGVACRTATRARTDAARRRAREGGAMREPAAQPVDEVLGRDLRRALDEEVSRLPARYRLPFVLCYLEGKTNDEAARQLGCPCGTVSSRLAWARERLRGRLLRRGLDLSAGLLGVLLSEVVLPTAVPPALGEATTRAAVLFASGEAAAAGVVTARVVALTRGVLQTMFRTRLRMVGGMLLALGLIGSGVCTLAYRTLAGEQPPAGRQEARQPERKGPGERPAPPAAKDPAQEDRDRLQGVWIAVSGEQDGRQLGADGVRGLSLSVKGDRMVLAPGPVQEPLRFKLDASREPRVMLVTATEGPDKGRPVPFIYRLERDTDTLKLCWGTRDGKKQPAEFAARAGSGLMLVVFKHEVRPPAVEVPPVVPPKGANPEK